MGCDLRYREGGQKKRLTLTFASMFVCVERVTGGVTGTRVRAIVVGARVVTASIVRATLVDVCGGCGGRVVIWVKNCYGTPSWDCLVCLLPTAYDTNLMTRREERYAKSTQA